MEIDWENVTIEFNAENSNVSANDHQDLLNELFELPTHPLNIEQPSGVEQTQPIVQHTEIYGSDSDQLNIHSQQIELTTEVQPNSEQPQQTHSTKRSRHQMEELPELKDYLDGIFDEDAVLLQQHQHIEGTQFQVDPELQNLIEEYEIFEDYEIEDDEDVPLPQQHQYIEHNNESDDAIYYCDACSLDFPSIAYLKRHQNTKKHHRAMRMQQRGKRVNQKKKYIRKDEINAGSQIKKEVRTIADFFQQKDSTINNLTSDDQSRLNMIDSQDSKTDTAKNFYENFDLDIENEEPAAKIQKLSPVEELMTDQPLVQHQTIRGNVLISRTSSQPLAHVQQQQIAEIQHRPIAYVKQQPIAQSQQHPVQQAPAILQLQQPNSKIQCQMCPRTFNLRCHFTQHMNMAHSENRNFKCSKCGKKFPDQESLNSHMEKHLGDKPFRCSKCVKSYNNKVDLKRHEKTHEDVKDHICPICGGGFVRYDHLEKHLLVHQRKMVGN
ncbi:putative zinc finger protein 840 [Chironomus tepperi]|uniref:putative zinc finger protein 840 n=1 Tax=Chironomus tepperi TaxID=113505 RepID=UPI00391F0258